MRTVLYEKELAGLRWAQVIAKAPHPVDHIHGVIVLNGNEEHVIHLNPLGMVESPQTLMHSEQWQPDEFDSVSLDEEH